MWIIFLVSGILFLLLLLFFLFLFGVYRYTFYSPKKGQLNDYDLSASIYQGRKEYITQLIDEFKAREHEDIYVKSFDNLKLHARLYENHINNKVAILCHGYRGTAYRDFCGGSKEVIELGYNVISIDQRAHGFSQGHSITFGVREVKDLLEWVKFARKRFGEDCELLLIGISMGGATVLMAANQVNNVKIIADAPYSSPRIQLENTIKKMKLPVKLFYPLVNLSSILFAHTNLNKGSAYDSIKTTNNRILIIHGKDDTLVPYQISYDLYQAYPDKIRYELFEGADHGVSYLVDRKRYCQIIQDFLK